MLTQIEGSLAVAENGAMCWPEVICAYPITPETHIIEALGEMVQSGRLQSCEFINVESEFSALSVAIGASAAGVRAYTATASQGLLFMAEAVYNVSGIGLPVVVTIGNRAIEAPINICRRALRCNVDAGRGLDPALRGVEPGAANLHILSFRSADRGLDSCSGLRYGPKRDCDTAAVRTC